MVVIVQNKENYGRKKGKCSAVQSRTKGIAKVKRETRSAHYLRKLTTPECGHRLVFRHRIAAIPITRTDVIVVVIITIIHVAPDQVVAQPDPGVRVGR